MQADPPQNRIAQLTQQLEQFEEGRKREENRYTVGMVEINNFKSQYNSLLTAQVDCSQRIFHLDGAIRDTKIQLAEAKAELEATSNSSKKNARTG